MDVLDRHDLSDIITWMPHGRSFRVKQPKLFASDILPRFFKQTKYLSFTRQLNLWGFKRISKGIDGGAYYHELFLRGRPYLAMRLKRQKIKGTGMKLTPNPKGEPNFYEDWPPIEGLQDGGIGGDKKGELGPLPPMPRGLVAAVGGAVGGRGGDSVGGGGGAKSTDEMLLMQQQVNAHYRYHQMMQYQQQMQYHYGAMDPYRSFPLGYHPGLHQHHGGRGGVGGDGLPLPINATQFPLSTRGGPPHPQHGFHHANFSMNPGNGGGGYEEVLLAPGVNGRHQQQQQPHSTTAAGVSVSTTGGGGGGQNQQPRKSDPIADELMAMLRNKQQQQQQQQVQRLRHLDRTAQLRGAEDMAMTGRGFAGGSNGGGNNEAMSSQKRTTTEFGSSASLPNGVSPKRTLEVEPRGPPFHGTYGDNNLVETSVKDALREAEHLEEMALAQRAKAIALANAMSRLDSSQKEAGGGGVVKDARGSEQMEGTGTLGYGGADS